MLDENPSESAAISSLERIRIAREDLARKIKAESEAKKAYSIAKREREFAEKDLERILNTETTPNLFNAR